MASRRTFLMAFALLSAATLAGNWNGLQCCVRRAFNEATTWNNRGYRGNGEHTDGFRELVERHLSAKDSLYYCLRSRDGSLDPDERSTHIALSWARSPLPVWFGGHDVPEDVSAVVVGRFLKRDFPGFWIADENNSALLWLRDDQSCHDQSSDGAQPPGAWREMAGVAIVCAMIALFVWWMLPRSKSCRSLLVPVLCVVVFFAFASALALAHTFMAPTGLGVHGGKAKLFYLSGGIPNGFFVDKAFSSYQPAYPPGLALLTLVAYMVAGGCGEWLTQLIPLFAATATLWLAVRRGVGCGWSTLWITAAFLGEQTLQMATLHYAEPFVAMLSLLGWIRLRECRSDLVGWMLLGSCGIFKAEGLVVVVVAVWAALGIGAVATARRTCSGLVGEAVFKWVKWLVVASALPLTWHIGCRLAGGEFYDYAPIWEFDYGRLCTAAVYLLKIAFFEPWRYGFIYPIAMVIVLGAIVCRLGRRNAFPPVEMLAAALVAIICLGAFAFVYSLSKAPDFSWHLWSSASRLLWVPSLFLLSECPIAMVTRLRLQTEI